MMDRGELNSEQ